MKLRLMATVAASALLVAACAGGDPEPEQEAAQETEAATDETESEAESEPATEEEPAAAGVECPIKVGASLSQTGDYARIAADQQAAYELFVAQLNAGDGLLGCDVELIVYDDRSTPETGARLYERLITEDKVDLIMGPYSSGVTGGVMPVVERYGMVNIAPMASADELFEQGFTWSFQGLTPASKYLQGAIEIMQEEGLRTIAYIGEDTAFPAAILKSLEEEQGETFELVFSELYPKGTTDFSALISQIGQAAPDAIFGGTYAQDAIAITGQLAEQGVSAPVIALTVGAAEDEYYESVGEDGQLIMGASHWEPSLDTPGNADFVAAYEEATGRRPGYHAAGSYGSFQALAEAVRRCECLDQEQIRQQVIDLEMDNVFGPFDVDETGAQVDKIGFMIQWMDGEKEIIWPFDVASTDYVVPHPGF